MKDWLTETTQSLVIPLPKKGNLTPCQNHHTISLIKHPSKIILQVILKGLKGTQIFNSQAIREKHLQHWRNLFHNFIDFKQVFDRVWHAGPWQVLRSFNMEEGRIQAIHLIYENSSSAVLLNDQLGEFFKTTVGVH